MLYSLIFGNFQAFANDPWFYSLQIVAILAAVVISLSVHELSHGLMAHWFGDDTAKNAGRLSLNPLVHLDPLGTFMLLIAPFGWAKPVPVNYFNLRRPRLGVAMVSFAGPLSNLLLAVVFGFLARFLYPMFGPANLLIIFFEVLMVINFSLLIFNLIPIPPLDGSKILFSALPHKFDNFKDKFSVYGPIILLILVFADSFMGVNIFGRIFSFFYDVLFRIFGF
ncbi:MAG: site-2 protease family protein [Candidatus Buchananbacteria bacterium]